MASSSHYRPNSIVKQSSEALHNPHFFKVVLDDALKEQKLEIPRKFVREYGLKALLKDQICLKVRDGKEWNVGLTKSNNGTRVWLHYGWEKLVGFYSVKSGYFLVFKYENPSPSFYVVIFDHTATEIEYPVKKTRLDKAKEKVKMETYFDDDCLDLDFKDGDLSFGVKKLTNSRWRPPSTGSQQARAMAKANRFQSMTLNPSFICKIWPISVYNEGGDGRVSPESMRPMNPRKTPPALTEYQLAVKKRASWFKSRRSNPSFMVTMRPRRFGEKYIKESVDVKLEVGDGRSWRVWCGVRWAFTRRRTELKGGWKRFAVDNELKEGDICVFELMKKNGSVLFKVAIFRLPDAE